MRLAFKSTDSEESRLSSIMWVSFVQPVEGLNRKKKKKIDICKKKKKKKKIGILPTDNRLLLTLS